MPVIRVDHLGKKYALGQVHGDLLSERLSNNLRRLFDRLGRGGDPSPRAYPLSPKEEFWALRDVSFEINQGEVVGIIGRNGAGKTTLLKILSRITEPTEGYAEIYGRVGSLLEVGTGFHPELTGRENVFLNGTILGMKRAEIRKKFDEIVAFAEVEKFIDTPVKRYSSGMYVRLAFAVAAHLEPEILLVDEVLAVGDAAFQKKCLGKMGEVAKEGRTVLFVSHNMGAVESLCEKAIYIDKGRVAAISSSEDVISRYVNDLSESSSVALRLRTDRIGNGRIRATGIGVHSNEAVSSKVIRVGESTSIAVDYEVQWEGKCDNVTIAIDIDDMVHNRIVTLWSKFNNEYFFNLKKRGKLICEIPELCLRSGSYFLNISIQENAVLSDYIRNACVLDVEYGKYYDSGMEPVGGQGFILQRFHWKME